MTTNLNQLKELIKQLEQALKQANLWQQQIPTEYQLSSSEPFALDRLEPQQWLQWIFIPIMQDKMAQATQISDLDKNLASIAVSPYLEVVFKDKVEAEYKPVFDAILDLESFLKNNLIS